MLGYRAQLFGLVIRTRYHKRSYLKALAVTRGVAEALASQQDVSLAWSLEKEKWLSFLSRLCSCYLWLASWL